MENYYRKKEPLVRFAHKSKNFSNSSLAMPVQERSAKAPRHSVMALRPLLTDPRFGILCLPDTKGEKNAFRAFLY